MVGLIIALGLLMDDAIVISENVASHLARGKSALDAVIDGVGEVKNGVIASFTTTICVFGPLAFLEGNMGKVLKVMPVVLIMVLAVSLIEAFWILPNHLAHSLAHHNPNTKRRFRRRFDGIIEWLRENVLGRAVDVTIRWRYLTVGITIAVFIMSVGMLAAGFLKYKAFPDIDGNVIMGHILLPQGTPLERTEELVTRLTDAIDKLDTELAPRQPGGRHLVENVSIQFNVNTEASESGAHVATVTADLLSAEIRIAAVDGMRTVTVQGDVDSRITNTSQIMKKLNMSFIPEFRKRFPQIRTSLEGETKESAETVSSLIRSLLVGLVGIFILLSFLFRSYIEPVVVMVAVPLSFIGAIWGHMFMDLNLPMPGLMGAASLAGIVVNDSILLVEFIKIHVRNGATVTEAAPLASRERFRAVLLTSLTTIAGLLPLLSERSTQAQVLIPMAVSIVFGLMASTVLVLIVVPSLYAILGDLGLTSVKADETQRRVAPSDKQDIAAKV
jgi:multidrug efflux pump subunit AcrB